MIINKKEILNQNLNFFDFDLEAFSYLKHEKEHYRLLTYISKSTENIIIIDAGTSHGHSCLALAQNPRNKVITYDIKNKNFPFFNEYKNIKFKQLDINKERSDIIKSAKVILLDIDPHDGVQEKLFTDYLKQMDYKGYVFCDDIHLNHNMENWWQSVKIEKYDITDIGHFSGTGLINFNQDGNFKING